MPKLAYLLLLLLLSLPVQARAEVVHTPKDKVGHLILGAVTYGGCRVVGYKPETCLYAAMAVGVAKELYDYAHPKQHSTEFMDFAATSTGGLLMFTVEKAF